MGWEDVKRAWVNLLAVAAVVTVVFVLHAAIAVVIIVCMASVEFSVEFTSKKFLHVDVVLIYGKIKLSYLFQTIDLFLMFGFGILAFHECYKIIRDAQHGPEKI